MREMRLILFLCILSFGSVFGAESGRILQTTLSQKTVIVNYGSGDGIILNDVAKFFYKPGFFKDTNLYIGEARAIKVFPNRSFWIMNYEESAIKLEKNDQVILFKIKEYQRYVRDLEVKRRKYVMDLNQDDYQNFVLEEDGPTNFNEFHKLSDGRTLAPTLELLRPSGKDAINAYELDRWQYRKKNDYLEDKIQNSYFFFPKGVYKLSSNEELIKNRFLKDIDLMIKSHFQMIGNPEANLLDYLKGKSKDIDFPLLYSKFSFHNTFDEKMYDHEMLKKEQKDYQKYLVGQGPKWSKNYSDNELIDVAEESGLVYEKLRENLIYNTKLSDEVFASYQRGVYNQSLNADDQNPEYRKINSSLSVGYELYLQKINPEYYEYSLLMAYRHIKNYGSIGKENGEITDNNITVHGILYPWQHPGRIRRLIPFAGVGIGYGFSYIEENNNFLNNYNTLIFPSLMVGLKYRFHLNYGLKLDVVYENARYKLADSRQNNEMPSSTNVSDLKAGIGLSIYF